MNRRTSRVLVTVLMVLGGAYLCASGTAACSSLATEAAISSTDMCFIFDCTNGALGGLVDPCAPVGGLDKSSGDTGDEFLGDPFFADCRQLQQEQEEGN